MNKSTEKIKGLFLEITEGVPFLVKVIFGILLVFVILFVFLFVPFLLNSLDF